MMADSEAATATAAEPMAHIFTQEYFQIPVVTRAYTTACVLTTAAVVRNNSDLQDMKLLICLNLIILFKLKH